MEVSVLSFSKHNKIHNKVFSLRTKAPVSFLPSENQEKQTAMCSLSLLPPPLCVCAELKALCARVLAYLSAASSFDVLLGLQQAVPMLHKAFFFPFLVPLFAPHNFNHHFCKKLS